MTDQSPDHKTEQENQNAEADPKLVKISELSKSGYQFIKEDKLNEAEDEFKSILELDENNNYVRTSGLLQGFKSISPRD